MAKIGRPTILNQELIQRIAVAIHQVLIIRHVCGKVQIHPSRFYDWMARGEEDFRNDTFGDHRDLYCAVRTAQADEIQERLDVIKDRKANWQSNAWILERCFREDFGAEGAELQQLGEIMKKLCEDVERIKGSPTVGTIEQKE